MRNRDFSTQKVVCVATCICLLCASAAGAPQTSTVELSFEAGGTMAKTLTPAKVLGRGRSFSIPGSQGSLSVGGSTVMVKATWNGRAFYIGLDADGNGRVGSRELVQPGRDRAAAFRLKLPGGGDAKRAYAIILKDVRISVRGRAVSYASGRAVINGCQKGKFNGHLIRIIDDNLDGKFSQDGRDAIAIGKSAAAVPLRKVHQIGDRHCELKVAADGSSVSLTPLSDLKLGVVDVPIRSGGVVCLVLEDRSGKAYDLKVSGKPGIPPGNYRLSYGVLAKGRQVLTLGPTPESLTYPIVADMINEIRIGPPGRVEFRASLSGGKINIPPQMRVVGSGGELYNLDFAGKMGRPRVILKNGSTVLSSKAMEYG